MVRKAVFLAGFVGLVLAGCAASRPAGLESSGAVPLGSAGLGREPAAEVAFMALSLVDTPYAAGGSSPETGFDCSGFVAYVYARALQLRMPRTTSELARVGVAISRSDLRPGDLVFHNTLGRPFSHVGIYLGDMRFVHSPSTGGAVRVADMRLDYWTRRFDGARRISY
jgi:cell wall-associated NlpC family hydrolase